MRFDILTLFPEMFSSPFDESIIRRARDKGIVEIITHQIRDFAEDRHRTVDDSPYGGGAGMLMKPEPLAACIKHVSQFNKDAKVLLTSPQGEKLSHSMAYELSKQPGLIIICGRYEGVDERIVELFVDKMISIGDYVLSGGELAAMVVVDSVTRLLPGALGSDQSAVSDSFCNGLLEYPQYTRPPEFMGLEVPEALLSGNHSMIELWRRRESLKRTLERRPDLIEEAQLDVRDIEYLEGLRNEH